MVDAEDLKSFDHCDRVGSSPTIPTTLRPAGFGWQATVRGTMRVAQPYFDVCGYQIKKSGCVAQLVRALRSHRRGQRFESALIHHPSPYGLRVAGHTSRNASGGRLAIFIMNLKKNTAVGGVFLLDLIIVIPLRDSTRPPHLATFDMWRVCCVNRAIRPKMHSYYLCILHICAKNKFHLKFRRLVLCILPRCFDYGHHQYQIHLMIFFDTQMRY